MWAARRSGGLVDPTLVGALERAGYCHSLDQLQAGAAEPGAAIGRRRGRRPGRTPRRAWRRIAVDDPTRQGARDRAGLTLDTGGTGKGLCADAVAHRLSGYTRYVVDCGGDLAIGGVGAQLDPYWVEIEHPLTRRDDPHRAGSRGGVATSGLNVRVWQDTDGDFAHHLLDPSSGRPAWTGVVGATALAPSALEAETLAKLALLLGPDGRGVGARRARRADRPRRRRGRGVRPARRAHAALLAGHGAARMSAGSDPTPVPVVAGQPRLRDRRARTDHGHRAARARRCPRSCCAARVGPDADGPARAHRARGARRDRRSWARAAGRPVAASRAGRADGSLRDVLPAAVAPASGSSPAIWRRCWD